MKKRPAHLGVMIDMSRNAVMHVEGLKRFFSLLAKMGYNCAMLYTEDTYEVEGEPYFGYMRGRYSVEELRELDEYAASVGIELIPCIQTLAHLNAYIRWEKTPVDCEDILLTDDEQTYDLIDRMFRTLSGCIRSRNIHIGMDEAHMLGRGKHLDLHGYESANSVIKRHLARVCEIAKKYGYETPMLWADMFFRTWNDGQYYVEKKVVPPEVVEAMPQNVIPVYWDYYQNEEKIYDDMIYNHKQLSDKTWFGGGVWCWSGLVPFNGRSLENMLPALRACQKNGIRDIFFTMWGDGGGECNHLSQLPCLLYLAEYARGNTDEEKIKAKFRRLTGMDYDAFMKIDLPNCVPASDRFANPSKYMLFSDPFQGFLDYTVKEGVGESYVTYAKELGAVARTSRKYGFLFDCEAKLCEVMAVKYELGTKTRKAYQAGDRTELKRLAQEDYVEAERRIRVFRDAFEKMWFHDNKPGGFDVQDVRIGGILQRLASCRRRLLAYAAGRVDRIPELEEEVLPYGEKGLAGQINAARRYVSPNVY